MAVVVMCTGCGKLSQVEIDRAKARCAECRAPRRVMLDTEQNRERQSREVSPEEWAAAPRTPATRAACEKGPRPCPHLRCRHHLGRPGLHRITFDLHGRFPCIGV